MKGKFLAIIAGTAALTGLVSAPAHAQLSATSNNIDVNLTVPEILYLRTVGTININLAPADLAEDVTFNANGTYVDKTTAVSTANPDSSTLDETSPFNVSGTDVVATKTAPKVFAVWSNRIGGNITATVNPSTAVLNNGSSQATIASATAQFPGGAAVKGLVDPVIGDVQFTINLPGSTAAFGSYTGGKIDITATAN